MKKMFLWEILPSSKGIYRVKCHTCGKETETAVHCQGCDRDFCLRRCWTFHLCATLTDVNGRLIYVGEKLRFQNTDKVYRVVDMPTIYAKGGVAFGDRLGKRRVLETRKIIRPHFMLPVIEE